MALIENLERDHWQEFLRWTFALALDLLANDRFRLAGSSVEANGIILSDPAECLVPCGISASEFDALLRL